MDIIENNPSGRNTASNSDTKKSKQEWMEWFLDAAFDKYCTANNAASEARWTLQHIEPQALQMLPDETLEAALNHKPAYTWWPQLGEENDEFNPLRSFLECSLIVAACERMMRRWEPFYHLRLGDDRGIDWDDTDFWDGPIDEALRSYPGMVEAWQASGLTIDELIADDESEAA